MAAVLGRMIVYERERTNSSKMLELKFYLAEIGFGLPHLPTARHSINEGRLSLSQPLDPVQDKGFCGQ